LAAPIGQTHDEAAADANAQLICRARYLLLRLLRDRRQWQRERESLLERIRHLEAALQAETEPGSRSFPRQPR
ncbi:MAG: hypothetical protein GTO03_16625, partial [Planctomycetales bacterium]|nr:hypothetical protein [Planctomycetales bacterium]